jgi:hypothetical protein
MTPPRLTVELSDSALMSDADLYPPPSRDGQSYGEYAKERTGPRTSVLSPIGGISIALSSSGAADRSRVDAVASSAMHRASTASGREKSGR